MVYANLCCCHRVFYWGFSWFRLFKKARVWFWFGKRSFIPNTKKGRENQGKMDPPLSYINRFTVTPNTLYHRRSTDYSQLHSDKFGHFLRRLAFALPSIFFYEKGLIMFGGWWLHQHKKSFWLLFKEGGKKSTALNWLFSLQNLKKVCWYCKMIP